MKNNFKRQSTLPKIWRLTTLAIVFLLLSPLSSFAQQAFYFEKDKGIILPLEVEVVDNISFDTAQKFATAKEGFTYFEKYNTDIMHARFDYQKQTVTIYFLLAKRPDWKTENWHNYLEELNQQ